MKQYKHEARASGSSTGRASGTLYSTVLIGICALAFASTTHAQQTRTVDFGKEIFPILQRSCLECHGPKKQEGDLRLDRQEDWGAAGFLDINLDTNLDDHELIRRISLPRGDEDVMPAIGDPLSAQQVKKIRRWLDQGGKWPEGFEAGRHWAYVAPQRAPLPQISNKSWARSPIDYFVMRRLDIEGLRPSPRATPEKLVRRLYLDLIGLPPTPAEVNAFVDDPSDERYEAIIDELLQRAQFGERWARPWLDLSRYADSHGFQRDNLRDIWAYRDWVIRALNKDMPFDQFTIEQVAGDLLPNATESQRIATGFHRCTPTNVEAGSLPEETRIEQVIDRVNTTGAVWLGTTLECCQCHDHKYDPFSMRDYYQMLAFFNNTELEADRANPKAASSIKFLGPSMPLANVDRDGQRSKLQQEVASIRKQQAVRRGELESDLESWASEYAADLVKAPQSHVLEVVEFKSEGTSDQHEILADGSILLRGNDPPKNDIYQIRVRGVLSDVRAIKLEALRHDSLPGGGPGRGDPKRRNFVLNEFSAKLARQSTGDGGKEPVGLKFTTAQASFSQKNWDVVGTLNSETKQSGWAISPQFDKDHWAIFVADKRLELTQDDELIFTLKQQWGQARTIGRVRILALTGNVNAESIPQPVVDVVKKDVQEWVAKDRKTLVDYRVKQDAETKRLQAIAAEIAKRITGVAADTTLVMVELKKPREAAIFERGDYRKRGEPVSAAAPSIFHEMPAGPGNRLTLARWLVSPENPLVGRVTVNRWWAELFGEGLVATPEDFGIKGDLSTHPELLDWLAVEFVENGWSTKQLLKTIVMSATYQQSSAVTQVASERDAPNQLLARGARLRMDAERIRDNALSISGLLSLKQFGPPIRPYQPDGIWSKVGGTAYKYEVSPGSEQYRRGVYVVIRRGTPYPSFVNFDASARLTCTIERSRTNTPLQALTLLNDRVYVESARALAKRIVTDKLDQPLEIQLQYAFQLCTARKPSKRELSVLTKLFHSQVEAYQEKVKDASPESADKQANAEKDAWYSVATILLNLHETITKD